MIASNWIYTNGVNLTGLTWDASFSSEMTHVGFWLNAWEQDDVLIELKQGGSSKGVLTFDVTDSNSQVFVGLQDLTGFDQIIVTVDQQILNGYLAIDDLRFESQAVEAVPEPASLILLGTGLLGLVGWQRRRG